MLFRSLIDFLKETPVPLRVYGKLAASLVQPGRCIYLDAGTTTLAIAQHLIHMEPLTVVTNDFVIADYLLDNSNCTIIHTGGAVCRENRSCVGEAAATMLRSLMIDQAFISASSWNLVCESP